MRPMVSCAYIRTRHARIMTTLTDAYAPTDASYVLLAEFGITHVAAAGFLQLRQTSGTYPVLFSWYWLCASGALLLLTASLVYARLRRTLLDTALRAGMHFHLSVLVVLLALLAHAQDSPRCPTASLTLGARVQESETWLWPLGTVIGVTLATVQFLLSFFIASSPATTHGGSAAGQVHRICLTAVALGIFTQLVLHIQLAHLCWTLLLPTDDCSSDSIEPLESLGVVRLWSKYWTCVAKIAVLLAVDVLRVCMGMLRLVWGLIANFLPNSPAWWFDRLSFAPALRTRIMALLACIWPVVVSWWYVWHVHTSECILGFRTYNIVMAGLLSVSAVWLFFHMIHDARVPSAVTTIASKQQYRSTACFIGTQQTSTLHKKKSKLN